MAHELKLLKGSLVNKPHLIELNSFNTIMDYVNHRLDGTANVVATPKMEEDDDDYGYGKYERNYNQDTKTGVMYIDGPLTYRTSGWEAMCGGTSYEMLKEQMEAFVSYGAKTVAWMMSSGGGEAYSMIDTANYLRKLADENDIKIVAFVDGMAASACYGLGCVADEIVSTADSQVGSIGVLIQLMNNSKALEMAGYERTFISAGSDKVPFDKDGAFTESFMTKLQEQVDDLYEGFTSHVAGYRGVSQEAIKNTEANVFKAKDALQLGLVDKVMTVEEFYIYLSDVAQERLDDRGDKMSNKLGRMFNFNKNEDAQEMAKLEELQAQLTAVQTELSDMVFAKEELATMLAAQQEVLVGKEAELADALAIVAQLQESEVATKVSMRKKELSAVLAADKVEATLESLSTLDDSAFAVVLAGFAAGKATVEASDLMTELGADAEEEGESIEVEDKASAATKAILARMKNR